MPKRKTHDDFVLQVKNRFPNIKVLGIYQNNKIKIEFQCLVDGCYHKWMARPDNILSGYGCPECAKRKISILRAKTHKEFIEEVAIKNPSVKVLGKYIADNVKIEFQCNNFGCDYKWFTIPDKIIHQITGCPECAKINRAKKKTKTHDDFVNEVKQNNPNIEVIGKYINVKAKIEFKCLVCDNTWLSTPDSVVNGHSGCPRCAQPHGERMIARWLTNNLVNFVSQYKFDDCKDLAPLPFDFYLPEYNVCIEYDGEQHFRPVNFGGISDEDAMICFSKTQLHDSIKDNYCKQNKIVLIRISYLQKNNIDIILDNLIKNKVSNF